MGCKVTVLTFCLVFATVQAVEVSLTNVWKQDLGWQINCSWVIPTDDSLQSVRLFQNNQQFLIFRPETDGTSSHIVYRRVEDMISTNCAVPDDDRQNGTCVITLELYQPQRDDITISCEVSGEGPYFRIKRKNIVVEKFVPPTAAVVTVGPVNEETGRVTLNCSAGGVPLPNLSWTIGDQKIPRDFSGGAWNATSKLWHAWSALSYTPFSGDAAVCTPEISRAGQLVKGHPAEYNVARNIRAPVKSVEVSLTKVWKQDLGWQIDCSWVIPTDDSLMSVRLFKNNQQFLIFRPETFGTSRHIDYRRVEDMISTNCAVPDDDRQNGTCVMTLELHQPQRDDITISCEVSGEAPYFRIERKNLVVEKLATVQAVEVSLTKVWKQDLGWQINCSWLIPSDDSLQSVRLFQNNQQFLIFRPETDGTSSHICRRVEDQTIISTNCAVTDDNRQNGTCAITLELYQPQRDDITISCEVSGEGPYFRIKKKNIVVETFVPPTAAVVTVGSVNEETGQVTLNCSAGGVPLPNLTWTIGDQEIPRNFSGGAWNATSKLWHAWSALSYTPFTGNAAVCTPEISRAGQLVKGHAAEYNVARNIKAPIKTVEVSLTKVWKQDLGWQINCSWVIPTDDSLMSVRLFKNNQQFLIFRPETFGTSRHIGYRRVEDMISTNCAVPDEDRQNGTCVMSLELHQPQRDDITISCEVSGEAPYFRTERKNLVVEKFVPPTAAVVTVGSVNEETGRVIPNCSAGGVALPNLSWTIGDQKEASSTR